MNCPNCLSAEVVVSKAGNTGLFWPRQFLCLRMRCRKCSDRFFGPGWLLLLLVEGLASVLRPLSWLIKTTLRGIGRSITPRIRLLTRRFFVKAPASETAGRDTDEPSAALWQDRQAELDALHAALSTERGNLERALSDSERRSRELNQLSAQLSSDRDELRQALQTLAAESQAVGAGRRDVEADRRELQQLRRELEQERTQLRQASRAAEHQPQAMSELAELREQVQQQNSELNAAKRMLHETQHGLQAELQQYATRLEQQAAQLSQLAVRDETIPSRLDTLSGEFDANQALVQQVFQTLEEDRSALAQIRETILAQRIEFSGKQQAWIRGEIERHLAKSAPPATTLNTTTTQDYSIRFHCSNCATKLVVRSNYAGKRAVCKACDHTIVILGGKA